MMANNIYLYMSDMIPKMRMKIMNSFVLCVSLYSIYLLPKQKLTHHGMRKLTGRAGRV